MKVQQIHRTATVAWSHTSPLVATGTLVGTMSENFDPTGTLELFQVDYKQGASEPRAKIKTDEKLYKLAWSRDCSALGESLHMGLIAGGLENGVIGLWNPSRLLQYVTDAASPRSQSKRRRRRFVEDQAKARRSCKRPRLQSFPFELVGFWWC